MPQKYYFDPVSSITIDEIGLGIVANNVRFVFDTSLTLSPGQMVELNDGQWFLISYTGKKRQRRLIDGKWSL